MSQKDKAKWEAMLDADPKLRAAWHGFAKQLAHDAAFLKLGVQPTGEAIGKAAQMVEDWPTHRTTKGTGFFLMAAPRYSLSPMTRLAMVIEQLSAESGPSAAAILSHVGQCPFRNTCSGCAGRLCLGNGRAGTTKPERGRTAIGPLAKKIGPPSPTACSTVSDNTPPAQIAMPHATRW